MNCTITILEFYQNGHEISHSQPIQQVCWGGDQGEKGRQWVWEAVPTGGIGTVIYFYE